MRAHLILEWKKQPWGLHLFWLILLTVLLSYLAVGWTTTAKHGMDFSQTSDVVHMAKPTTEGERQFWVWYLEHDSKSGEYSNVERKVQQRELAALKRRDYRRVNQIMYDADTKDVHVNKQWTYTDYMQTVISNGDPNFFNEITAVLRYELNHNMNRLAQIDTSAAVINNFAGVFGISLNLPMYNNGHLLSSQTVLQIILIMGLVTACFAMFCDHRARTDSFMQVVPLGAFRRALLRAAVTIAVINGILIFVALAMLLSQMLIPGHDFGTLQSPVVFTLRDHVYVLPLWRGIVAEWGLFNCWLVMFTGAGLVVSLLSRSELVGIFLLAIFTFAQPLHILALVPANLRRFFPAQLTNFSAMVLHKNEFSVIPLWQIFATISAWAAAFWLLGWALQRISARRRTLQ